LGEQTVDRVGRRQGNEWSRVQSRDDSYWLPRGTRSALVGRNVSHADLAGEDFPNVPGTEQSARRADVERRTRWLDGLMT
jgi:hypothetical protein